MDDLAARGARVKPLAWRVQAPHTTDVVSGETVVLVAMLPWGAVAITKTLKETGYRVCEGASRSGGFASIEDAGDWFGATRIAPAIDTASVGAALEKVRLLRSEINAVNATKIAPRMERGRLGQSLRGIYAAPGSNKEKEPAAEGFRQWRDDLRCHGAPKASCWQAGRNAATLRLDATG